MLLLLVRPVAAVTEEISRQHGFQQFTRSSGVDFEFVFVDDKVDDDDGVDDDYDYDDDDSNNNNYDDDEAFEDRGGSSKKRCETITDLICRNEDFAILCEVLKDTGYYEHLDNKSASWTLFAPTDDAFDSLDRDVADRVFSSHMVLRDVLLYHTVRNKAIVSNELECTMKVKMANARNTRTVCLGGGKVSQKGDGNSRNKLPEIVGVDLEACNGVIHVVSQLILPLQVTEDNDSDSDYSNSQHNTQQEHYYDLTPTSPTRKPTQSPPGYFYDDHRNTPYPTPYPTPHPTLPHKRPPTYKPMARPTYKPVSRPTYKPVARPTNYPTRLPTYKPTYRPTYRPTYKPTYRPTYTPTYTPTYRPTYTPTYKPVVFPITEPRPAPSYTEPYPQEDHPDESYHDFFNDLHTDGQREGIDCPSIAEVVCKTPGFALLCEALTITGLINFLEFGTEWTLFAPTNEAIKRLIESVPKGTLNLQGMTDLLRFHLVEDIAVRFDHMFCERWIQMSDGDFTYTHCRGFDKYQVGRGNGFQESVIMLKDSPIILREDIFACNGIIHSIDTMLLPEWWQT